ncbi:MAG TPA: MerR family transcriptional regulator [Beutenbergiaceae bacterium]|nr:MerR family transcriptional regulator [Beutenbergiaceae bacterium]
MAQHEQRRRWRIGEIAAATGLTVRTLHHYEAIGLVVPATRSPAGHRLYGPEEVDRLYRVSMWRMLGLSLKQVRTALEAEPAELHDALAQHLDQVTARATQQQHLRAQLLALIERIDPQGDPSPDLLNVLADIVKLQPQTTRRISILVYADVEAAYRYLIEVFGLGPGETSRDHQGVMHHAVVHAGDGEVWLHAESATFALSSPQRLGASTATIAVLVDDVDEHHRNAARAGARIRYEPVDQPYGYREYGALDLENHLWSFMRPLEERNAS